MIINWGSSGRRFKSSRPDHLNSKGYGVFRSPFLFKKPSVNHIGIFLSQTKSLIDYSKQKVLNNLDGRARKEVSNMTICPIALAVGCEKCPAFNFCPLTTVLGIRKKKNLALRENKTSKSGSLNLYLKTIYRRTINQMCL